MTPRATTWAIMLALLASLLPLAQRPAGAVAKPKVGVSYEQFSPNRDGERESTTISVTLRQAARVKLQVRDREGKYVGYIHGYGKKGKGTYRRTFRGAVKNSEGKTVALGEGMYYAEAVAKGSDGSMSRAASRFYINNTVRNASVRATRLSYNRYSTLFSPNGDGRKDGLVARFQLIRPASVRMRVLFGGRQVRVLHASFTRKGGKAMEWDGRIRRGGRLVWGPQGRYTTRIEATPANARLKDRLGTAHAQGRSRADTRRPSLRGGISRSSFNPSSGESTTVSFSVREPGYRIVKVLSAEGVLVYRTRWSSSPTRSSFTWNGRNGRGRIVLPGAYRILVYAEDRAGNAARPYPLRTSVRVTKSYPSAGRSRKTPWTGWWWPQLSTYDLKLYNDPGPMTRYDAYSAATGRDKGAYNWEYANHRTTDPANDWWGHCQAWAAAAMLEPQPYGTTKQGISFSQDDAEGLYAETWTIHTGWMTGTRFNGGSKGSVAYRDVHPRDFDEQVLYWIGEKKQPLMMDFTTGVAVWNYPVYAYQRSSTRSGGKEYVTMTVTRAAPYAGMNGTSPIRVRFYYTLQGDDTGWWSNPSGSSVNTHPDYIVRVGGRASDYGNPYVKPSVLNEIFR